MATIFKDLEYAYMYNMRFDDLTSTRTLDLPVFIPTFHRHMASPEDFKK